jgi:hypothetical protein
MRTADMNFTKRAGEDARNLLISLLAVHPQQPSAHLTCTYCGISMFGPAEELYRLVHRSHCAYVRALKYLAATEIPGVGLAVVDVE